MGTINRKIEKLKNIEGEVVKVFTKKDAPALKEKVFEVIDTTYKKEKELIEKCKELTELYKTSLTFAMNDLEGDYLHPKYKGYQDAHAYMLKARIKAVKDLPIFLNLTVDVYEKDRKAYNKALEKTFKKMK